LYRASATLVRRRSKPIQIAIVAQKQVRSHCENDEHEENGEPIHRISRNGGIEEFHDDDSFAVFGDDPLYLRIDVHDCDCVDWPALSLDEEPPTPRFLRKDTNAPSKKNDTRAMRVIVTQFAKFQVMMFSCTIVLRLSRKMPFWVLTTAINSIVLI